MVLIDREDSSAFAFTEDDGSIPADMHGKVRFPAWAGLKLANDHQPTRFDFEQCPVAALGVGPTSRFGGRMTTL